MNKIRIVIKCKGLRARTNDLQMGLGILDQIAKHGIMNYSFISNGLLEKASQVISHATDRIAALGIIKKVQENFKTPEFAPTEEAVNEEEAKEQQVEEPVKQIETRRKGRIVANSWTIEEDKLICDMMHLSPKEVSKNKELRARHTKWGIKTRMSLFKNGKLDRISPDRAKLMKAYLSGEQVQTPVADINRRGLTPIVDAIEKKYSGKKSYVTKSGKTFFLWSEEELARMRENIDLPGKKLAALFPGRTLAAVMYKQGEIKGVKKHSKPRSSIGKRPESSWTEREEQVVIDNANMKADEIASMLPGRTRYSILAKRTKLAKQGRIKDFKVTPMNQWTQDEDDAIRLNMNMSPKNLAKLPWLKNRTINSIGQRKFKLSKERHES